MILSRTGYARHARGGGLIEFSSRARHFPNGGLLTKIGRVCAAGQARAAVNAEGQAWAAVSAAGCARMAVNAEGQARAAVGAAGQARVAVNARSRARQC